MSNKGRGRGIAPCPNSQDSHQKDFLIFPLQIGKTPLYLHCNSKGQGVNLNPDSTSSTPYINTQRIG